jgi:DNA replicative helicase MCM subunit Mcm2 (Cdc46/Mcm family)
MRFRGIVEGFRDFYATPTLYTYRCRCGKHEIKTRSSQAPTHDDDGFKMNCIHVEYCSTMYFNLLIPVEGNPAAIKRCYFIVSKQEYEKNLFDVSYVGEEVDILATTKTVRSPTDDNKDARAIHLEVKGIQLLRQRNITPERQQDIVSAIQAMPVREAIDAICNSICPHIYGNRLVKQLALLVAVGLKKPDPDLGEFQNTALHILLMGDPSVGKTKTVKPFTKYFAKSMFMTGRGTTYVGLLGGCDKEKGGGFIMRIGQIKRSDKSFIIMDELDKIDENTLKGLYTGMSEGEHTITNVTGNATFRYNTSFIMCANPVEGKFDLENKKHSKITFRADFLSRVSVVHIVEKAYEKKGKYDKEKHDQYLQIRLGQVKQQKVFDDEFLYDYATLVRQHEGARETPEVRQLNKLYMLRKTEQIRAVRTDDYDTAANLDKKTADERTLDTIRIMQKRIANAVFSPVVLPEHFELAADILERGMFEQLMEHNLTPQTLQEHIADAERTKIPQTRKEKYYAVMGMIPKEGEIEWGKLLDTAANLGISEIELEQFLAMLRSNSEIIEPRHGFVQRL